MKMEGWLYYLFDDKNCLCRSLYPARVVVAVVVGLFCLALLFRVLAASDICKLHRQVKGVKASFKRPLGCKFIHSLVELGNDLPLIVTLLIYGLGKLIDLVRASKTLAFEPVYHVYTTLD
jgi:hypothetical protein